MNPLKRRLDEGGTALGFLVSMPSVQLTQILAASGADWLLIDLEHGPIDNATVHAMIAATAGTACAPIVRVPSTEPWLAKPALDAGAFGLVFPMICSARQAQAAARAVRYPPRGVRGWGPFYAPARWGLSSADYTAAANDQVLCIILIEHIEAVRRIDEILAVPGIDVAVIAPFDLSQSLGRPGDFEHPDVAAAMAEAEDKILARGLPMGGLARTSSEANAKIARGYRLLVLGYDTGLIEGAVAAALGGVER